jgi:hypothetical protein
MEIFSIETKTNPFRAFRIRLGFVVSPPGRNFPRGGCCFLSFDVCCVSLTGRQAGERPSDPHPLPGDRLEDGEARRGVLPARHRLQREDDRRTRPESHGRHGDPIGRRWVSSDRGATATTTTDTAPEVIVFGVARASRRLPINRARRKTHSVFCFLLVAGDSASASAAVITSSSRCPSRRCGECPVRYLLVGAPTGGGARRPSQN